MPAAPSGKAIGWLVSRSIMRPYVFGAVCILLEVARYAQCEHQSYTQLVPEGHSAETRGGVYSSDQSTEVHAGLRQEDVGLSIKDEVRLAGSSLQSLFGAVAS